MNDNTEPSAAAYKRARVLIAAILTDLAYEQAERESAVAA